MRRYFVVLARKVLLRVVFLCVGEEVVELDALREVFHRLKASDVLEEFEISENVDARGDDFLPVYTLKSDVGVVLLEGKVEGLEKVDVRSFHGVDGPFVGHLELILIEVLWEDFHFSIIIIQ